jgi:predicted permease
MSRFAARLLHRVLGSDRAESVLGDLEEELARRQRGPRLRSLWLCWQATAHALAVLWAERGPADAFDLDPGLPRAARRLEVTTMLQDVRHAIRGLRAAPAFTAVALVVLTLGIGASTAIFSVVDAVVLRALPFDESDRLVQVTTYNARTDRYRNYETPQDFADWKAQQDVFAEITAVGGVGGFTVTEGGRPEDLFTLRVTAGYFDVFRVRPALGRPFTSANEIDGNHRVAIISHAAWRGRFGSDPDIVGRTVAFPSGTYEIIGVMPRGFQSPLTVGQPTDIWVPYVVPEGQKQRGRSRSRYLMVTARLKDGVSLDQADAQVRTITASLAREYPDWFTDQAGVVRSLHEAAVGRVRSWMLMLLGAVGVVLLIACVNVANLLLARATARTREIRIRAALGASRWQLARGLLVESLVLSTTGTLCALVVAVWGVGVLRAALPPSLPRIAAVAIDLRVLGAAALAALVTGLLFGLAPALQCSRPDLSAGLREGGRSVAGGRERLRSALVVAEVALAVLLVVGAGLFVSSFVRLTGVDIGLDHRNVLAVEVSPRVDTTQTGWVRQAQEQMATVAPEILARVRAIPGVDEAGLISGGLPLSGNWSRSDVRVPDREGAFEGDDSADVREVTPGYARAVRAEVRRGRHVDETDTAGAFPVIVLNEEAVRRYLGDREPLGARVTVNDVERTVVGVVADVRLGGPESAVRPEVYVPVSQSPIIGGDLVIRTTGDPQRLVEPVREAIWASLPDVTTPRAETMTSLLQGLVAQRHFNMIIVGLFGGLALAIVAAGIYGVMAYLVARRTQEIGVRIALGAVPTRVLAMVLRRAFTHVSLGLALGLIGAWQLSRLVESFLFQVAPHDPAVYAATAALLLGIGLIAALVPARRAARVDPLVALRAE